MYNEDRKLSFLQETRDSMEYGISLFRATEALETATDTDLCELDTEKLESLYEDSFGTRQRAIDSATALIQSYVSWCKKNGFPTSDAAFGLDVDISQKIRRMMVASPMHLASIMDQVFPPVDSGSVDCIYRCYLWMVFMGIMDVDTVDVMVNDVDFDDLKVVFGGRGYDLYRESIPAFRLACTATEFNYVHENPYYVSVRQRFAGDRLIRGVRADHVKIQSIKPYIKKRLTESGFNLSARRIRLSGIFYKAYEFERCGLEVNFNDEVMDQFLSKQREFSKNYSRNKAIKMIERDFQSDYENWKRAFCSI